MLQEYCILYSNFDHQVDAPYCRSSHFQHETNLFGFRSSCAEIRYCRHCTVLYCTCLMLNVCSSRRYCTNSYTYCIHMLASVWLLFEGLCEVRIANLSWFAVHCACSYFLFGGCIVLYCIYNVKWTYLMRDCISIWCTVFNAILYCTSFHDGARNCNSFHRPSALRYRRNMFVYCVWPAVYCLNLKIRLLYSLIASLIVSLDTFLYLLLMVLCLLR